MDEEAPAGHTLIRQPGTDLLAVLAQGRIIKRDLTAEAYADWVAERAAARAREQALKHAADVLRLAHSDVEKRNKAMWDEARRRR